MNKGIVLGVVFLFVLMSFTSISGIQINNQVVKPSVRGNILYVGGSGPGNYTKIQDAIDNASDGDTVFVYSGIYCESIVMDKSIRLIGEKTNNTIIDGFGSYKNAITITADNCILERFRVVNTSDEYWTYAGIKILSNNNLIQNNTISFHATGIWVGHSDGNKFYNNYFDWNMIGINLNESCKNDVSNNNFLNNIMGIQTLSNSNYNLFSYNNFNTNGIQLLKSSHNEITRNNFVNNTNNKFNSAGGMTLFQSNYNDINNNTIANYWVHGISIQTSSNNLVIRNNIIHNGWFGVYLLDLSTKNFISQNNFFDNGYGKEAPVNFFDNAFIWNSFFNHWNGNYWDDWPFRLPRIIKGRLGYFGLIPWFNIDWNPAKKPYNITYAQGCDIE
jgi:parallel beta-helix repeat protein